MYANEIRKVDKWDKIDGKNMKKYVYAFIGENEIEKRRTKR